jgi:iron-sulfur cluster insertion protein
MSVVETYIPSVLQLTANAARKVNALVSEEGNPHLKLRVYVTGGGCSGFQYGFSFDESINEDDTVVTRDGADLLVDPLSVQYLTGSSVDYVEGLQGSRFVVENPLATTTCGCGMSFSI